MTKITSVVLFSLFTLHWSTAAPSEINLDDIANVKVDDTVKVNLEESKQQQQDLAQPELLFHDLKSEGKDSTQGQRQKRWYDYYGFEFPPFNPVYKRDDAANTGNYGIADPFDHIHRRLQEISSFVRNPIPPPLPPPIPRLPSYIPVIFVPQIGCGCSPDKTPSTPEGSPVPPRDDTRKNETTPIPDINNRWPEMEDENQNWGLVDKDTTVTDGGDDNDGARPISFVPIRPKIPMNRPPPPVEHGSSQGDVNALTTAPTNPPPQISPDVSLQAPNICDSAVVSCCHMPQVTYDCFALQGCPDPSVYGNPCDPGVIVRVIERFRKYYNQKNG